MLRVDSRFRASTRPNRVRDTNTAVNTFETSPKNNFVAKPCIGPDPNW